MHTGRESKIHRYENRRLGLFHEIIKTPAEIIVLRKSQDAQQAEI
jgi:hypothetical protein